MEMLVVETPESWLRHLFKALWSKNDKEPQGFTDIIFRCPDGSVEAHRMLLKICCFEIDQILNVTKGLGDSETVILVPDFSIEVVRRFLELLYTSRLKLNEMDELQEVSDFSKEMLGFQLELEYTLVTNNNAEATSSSVIIGRKKNNDPGDRNVETTLGSPEASCSVFSVRKVDSAPASFRHDLPSETSDTPTLIYSLEEGYQLMEVEADPAYPFATDIRPRNARRPRKQIFKSENNSKSSQERSCSLCRQTFPNRKELILHKDTVHTEQRCFQCLICMKRFGQRGHMKEHILQVHQKVRKFQCNNCDKAFGHKGSFKKHLLAAHNLSVPSKKIHPTVNEDDLPTVLGEVAYQPSADFFHRCLHCDQSFSDLATLENHQRSHKSSSKKLRVFQSVLD